MTGPDHRRVTLDLVIKEDTRGADKTVAAIDKVDDSAESAGKSLRGMTVNAKDLDVQIKKTTERISELDAALVSVDDKELKREHRQQTSRLRFLEGVAKRATPAAGGGIGEMFSAMPLRNQAMAGGAIAGIALAPAIAAAVSGAILGGVGIGGVVGGAVLASRDSRVKAAWREMGQGMLEELKPAQDAFIAPTMLAAKELGRGFEQSGISEYLAEAAVLVEPLTEGLSGFLKELGPGIGAAFRGAEPVMEMLSQELPELGASITEAFEDLEDAAPGAAEGLGDVFDILERIIKSGGSAAEGLTKIYQITKAPFADIAIDVLPWFGLAEAVGQVGDEAPAAADGVEGVGDKTETAAEKTARLVEQLNTLEGSLRAVFSPTLDAARAADAWEAALDEVAVSVDEYGTSLDATTEKGRANRDMIWDGVEAAIAMRDKNIEAGMGAEEANGKYEDQIAVLQRQAEKYGFNRKKVEELIAAYKRVPDGVTTNVITRFKTIGHSSSGTGLSSANARAEGGPVQAGVPYLINERGMETVTFPAGGQVHPANLTPMGAGGGGGSLQPFRIDGNAAFQALFNLIVGEVKARGGQFGVLGLKAP